jgi:hypothetical protein
MVPAIFFPVAASIPSNPGDEFTSIIIGPELDCNKSTPAIPSPKTLAAFNAAASSSSESSMIVAVPPLCRF